MSFVGRLSLTQRMCFLLVSDGNRGIYETEAHVIQPSQERRFYVTRDALVEKGYNVPEHFLQIGRCTLFRKKIGLESMALLSCS